MDVINRTVLLAPNSASWPFIQGVINALRGCISSQTKVAQPLSTLHALCKRDKSYSQRKHPHPGLDQYCFRFHRPRGSLHLAKVTSRLATGVPLQRHTDSPYRPLERPFDLESRCAAQFRWMRLGPVLPRTLADAEPGRVPPSEGMLRDDHTRRFWR